MSDIFVTLGYVVVLNLSEMDKKPDSFDQKALTWDDDPQKQERAKKIAQLIRSLRKGGVNDTAMEYGCGTGLLSFNLRQDFTSVLLVDTSKGMLEVLNDKILSAGLNHFTTLNIDLTQPNQVPPGSVDCIYSLMTLHHVPNTDALLLAFSKITKPGGMIFLADLDKEDGSFHPEGTGGIHYGFERQDLQARTEMAGFGQVAFFDAFTMRKNDRVYPVFLMSAMK